MKREAAVPLQRAALQAVAGRRAGQGAAPALLGGWRRALGGAEPVAAGELPLHCAARAGDVAALRELLDAGASALALDDLARTPLQLASAAGHVGALRELLSAEAGAGLRWGALRGALAAVGSEAAARELLQAHAVALEGPFAEDALWAAASTHRMHSVEVLLAAGLDPDACDHEGFTALHRAAEHGHEDLARLLLDRGVLRDRQDVTLRTALHVASEHGQLAVAELLLAAGWDPARQDDCGCTPLHYASQWGHVECVRALLAAGGPELVHAADRDGRTALHYAVRGDHEWLLPPSHPHALAPDDARAHAPPRLAAILAAMAAQLRRRLAH